MWEEAKKFITANRLFIFLLGTLVGSIIKGLGADVYKWIKILICTLFRYLRGFHRSSLKQMKSETNASRGTRARWGKKK